MRIFKTLRRVLSDYFQTRKGQYVGKALADALRAQEPLARPGWIGAGKGEEPNPTW